MTPPTSISMVAGVVLGVECGMGGNGSVGDGGVVRDPHPGMVWIWQRPELGHVAIGIESAD